MTEKEQKIEILLVCMPFFPIQWPSLALGQLVAAVKRVGLSAKVDYANLRFAKEISNERYDQLSLVLKLHFSFAEWIFSAAAFQSKSSSVDQFIDFFAKDSTFNQYMELFYNNDLNECKNDLKAIRQKAERFVLETAERIVELTPKIVGCTTSLMQYNSSLAVLREIKSKRPSIITVLGGAQCEAEMGLITIKKFNWIDYVVSGEADELFPVICKNLLEYGNHLPPKKVPHGVYARHIEHSRTQTAIVKNLDLVPVPDYADYFDQINKYAPHVKPFLVMESSRGCWKGEKNPCNFCGLNGKRCKYRTKSTRRVTQEFEQLALDYRTNNFLMTDTILNMSFFKNVFKTFQEKDRPYNIFFETTSNLSENQIKQLADGGVFWIQAGIENLQDDLLRLLNKGNSAIHNIALLKYAMENGILITWSILYDIPGDKEEWYVELNNRMPLLFHLQPPKLGYIVFDRFSEYYSNRSKYDLKLRPYKSYQHVYPFTEAELEKFSYYFEDKTFPESQRSFRAAILQMKDIWAQWIHAFYPQAGSESIPADSGHGEARLLESCMDNKVVLVDTRPCSVQYKHILSGLEKKVYDY
jgi:magnesium-protoporphyrin IX monomethyl ester (oxidative) cyclase